MLIKPDKSQGRANASPSLFYHRRRLVKPSASPNRPRRPSQVRERDAFRWRPTPRLRILILMSHAAGVSGAAAAGGGFQVRPGHVVLEDASSKEVIRSIHVAGTLRFATKQDTRLEVGLITIQPGDEASEDGFDCDAHVKKIDGPRPALEVGSPE